MAVITIHVEDQQKRVDPGVKNGLATAVSEPSPPRITNFPKKKEGEAKPVSNNLRTKSQPVEIPMHNEQHDGEKRRPRKSQEPTGNG